MIAVILIETFVLWQIISERDRSFANILSALFFGYLLALIPPKLIKRIVFEKEFFSIEKFLWTTWTIRYVDLIAIEKTMIKTRNGNFIIESMMNSAELRKILRDALRVLSRSQTAEKTTFEEVVSRTSANRGRMDVGMSKYKMRRKMKR